MDLHILSMLKAYEFRPDKPTYAIRIFSTKYQDTEREVPLETSAFYKYIAEYVFDDNYDDPWLADLNGPTWLDEQLAEIIIKEFAEQKSKVDALMVHCSQGKNRSPAVTMALNEIFELGHDTATLRKQYSEYNWSIYKTMIQAGKKEISF